MKRKSRAFRVQPSEPSHHRISLGQRGQSQIHQHTQTQCLKTIQPSETINEKPKLRQVSFGGRLQAMALPLLASQWEKVRLHTVDGIGIYASAATPVHTHRCGIYIDTVRAHFVWEYDAERRISVHTYTVGIARCEHTFRECLVVLVGHANVNPATLNEKNIPIQTSINICVAGYAVRMLDRWSKSQTHLTHTANVHLSIRHRCLCKFPLKQRSNWCECRAKVKQNRIVIHFSLQLNANAGAFDAN